ncbi:MULTISPECIES: ABC transporter substrate-binding protein [Ralstonia solanacearum species complex]|uniref:Ethanolamine utilization protein EutH n=2 Tax=Ralstonia solanacearum species complex TaxID=3116862 RepID=A0AAD0S4G7_RALSL|nr:MULTISPECIES: ABC transporter substrate-binding protein [Ralstonia solanacearum species complex]AXV80339.1 ethanolamine utilization protein EutH [Ralstonia solanacearum]AXW51486.1 ethanolamine utilization protein EutH [Ralstonia solanacearum]QUP52545.1 ABC transporter substrate-binding protein [Ralstonia syzygii]CBJ49805.1 putative substrate-binding periplasmic (Pbp) abc transporter protein [Ralstonia solanacearum PSI07]
MQMGNHTRSRRGTRLRRLGAIALTLCAGLTASVAQADISIIQSLPLSGSQAVTGRALNAGARLYFDWLNLNGGIHGETVRLVARDDEQKVEQTVRNVRDMARIDNPVALLTVVGTANVEALMREGVLAEARLPLVGPATGASSMTGDPLVFPIKASYQQEIDKMITALVTIGVTRIGVLYQDDALGKEATTGVERTLKAHKLAIAAMASYPRNTASVGPAVDKLLAADVQAIFLGATAEPAAQFVRQYRERGGGAQLLGLSSIDPGILQKVAGLDAVRGYSLALVMPNPGKSVHPVIREFNRARAAVGAKDVDLSFRAVEGFVAAKVLAEAIRRAGPKPTREQVRHELTGLRDYDVGGGFTVDFTDRSRPGSHYVELGVVGPNGLVIQ